MEAPSLCDRWRVRDVVGHLILLGEVNPATAPISLIRFGLSIDRWLGGRAIRRADEHPRGELILAWDLQLPRTGLARFRTDASLLYEHVVHHQDVRRPLRRPRQISTETLLALLDLAPWRNGAIGSKKRAAGLRLEATDVDWSHGEGPGVRGSAEAILLALAGRGIALDELEGDGLTILRSRALERPTHSCWAPLARTFQ